MDEQIPDKTVIIIILVTIMFIFAVIFSVTPTRKQINPDIQWKDSPNSYSNEIKI